MVSFFELAKIDSEHKKFVKKIMIMLADINVIVNCMNLSHLFKFAEGSGSNEILGFFRINVQTT